LTTADAHQASVISSVKNGSFNTPVATRIEAMDIPAANAATATPMREVPRKAPSPKAGSNRRRSRDTSKSNRTPMWGPNVARLGWSAGSAASTSTSFLMARRSRPVRDSAPW
jgi:hypothetical protein